MLEALAAFAILTVLYGLFSRKLEALNVTSPMVFVAAGLVLSLSFADFRIVDFRTEAVLLLGEAALVVVLFSDASRISFANVRGSAAIPGRLLLIAMPLTIFIGAAIASRLFSNLDFWEAAILGAILAPTDAGLGQAVASDPRVPQRIRQSLNIESGLNDGLSTPFFIIFLGIAQEQEGFGSPTHWLAIIAEQIGFGALIGIAVACVGGYLLRHSLKTNLITADFQRLAFPALALTAWLLADFVDGNGFIAAFVAGITIARILRGTDTEPRRFIDVEGKWLVLAVFFIFGISAEQLIRDIGWTEIFYALLSLTLIRMVPVAISLIGVHLKAATTLFVGWFGPRGLASVVLMLVLIDEASDLEDLQSIELTVVATVLISVFLHGVSANPLIRVYKKAIATLSPDAPELQSVEEIPTRTARET